MSHAPHRSIATRSSLGACALGALAWLGAVEAVRADLPPVPTPPGNPTTEAKRVLGKALFWDEQLSSTGTVACGTCHLPGSAGAALDIDRNAGFDELLGTADDVFGSPGVRAIDETGAFVADPHVGFEPQVTGRASPGILAAMFDRDLFWDGRADGRFVDPITGETVLANRAALEHQALGPILNSVEMAHAGRTWDDVTDRLERARPLALATDLPADLAEALIDEPDYPTLFADAFGDEAITPVRIGMAIAAYERTLVPDETAWDRFDAGETNALSPAARRGLNAFTGPARCAVCHTPPLFTNGTFRNVGLRPIEEDAGRFDVTGDPADRGRFKVPTLRNAALKSTFFHDGSRSSLTDAIVFYDENQPREEDNLDPVVAQGIAIPPPVLADLRAFIQQGLVDPRVAAETFPFDRPTLWSERDHEELVVLTDGIPGERGAPGLIAENPPIAGETVRFGLVDATPGATAWLARSPEGPDVTGRIAATLIDGPFTVKDDGSLTAEWAIPARGAASIETHVQWMVVDASAPAGLAASPVVRIRPFCGLPCPIAGDLNGDGTVDGLDLSIVLGAFGTDDPQADADEDGTVDGADLALVLGAWSS